MELLSQCREMAMAIAPELHGRLYVLDCADVPQSVPSDHIFGAAISGDLVAAVRDAIGSAWTGTGDAVVMNLAAIREAALPGHFERCVRGIFAHEVAHLVPAYQALPIMETVEAKTTAIAALFRDAKPGRPPVDCDMHHDMRFNRRAVHCAIRAEAAGFDCATGRVLLWPSKFENYAAILADEVAAMKNKSFSEIESIEPPAELCRLWQANIAYASTLPAHWRNFL